MAIVPSKKRWETAIKSGFKGGLAGGLPVGFLFLLTRSPFWSSLIGSIIGSAIVGGDEGKIVAVNGIMDAVINLFVGMG